MKSRQQLVIVIKYCSAPRHKRAFSLGDIILEIDEDYDDYESTTFNQKLDFIYHDKGSKSYEGTTNINNTLNYRTSRAGLSNAKWLITQFANDLELHEIKQKFERRRKQRLLFEKLKNQSQEVTRNNLSQVQQQQSVEINILDNPIHLLQNDTMLAREININSHQIQQVDDKLQQEVDSQSSDSSLNEEIMEQIIEVLITNRQT